jgi:hypothetical protein
MIFNANKFVRVKLTDFGRMAHRKNYDALMSMMPEKAQRAIEYQAPTEDAHGWSRWQLWQLMRDFGPWIRMGGEAPFEMDIDIVEKS